VTVTATTPSVLFVCVKNGGKSQMAAGLMRKIAGAGSLRGQAGSRWTLGRPGCSTVAHATVVVTDSLTECPDNGVAYSPEWARQVSCAQWSKTHPGDTQEFEIEVAGEKLRHRTDGEAADVVTVADMQCRRLAARQQQQAVVQSGEIRNGHHENASQPQYPLHLPQSRAEILHRDEVTVPDHQVKVAIGSGEGCCLHIDLTEVCRGAHSGIAFVFVIVDNRTARGGQLVTEEQSLSALAWLNLEKVSLILRQGLDHAGDLTDDAVFDPLMPAFPRYLHGVPRPAGLST